MNCAAHFLEEKSNDCTRFGGDAASSVSGDADNRVVLVGVRLDSPSKELLTWALVKVARSGDRVVALHILSPGTEGQSTFVSLVKTFDSMMAAYEGFCNLKQVDLKLKVCRGASARKLLVQEAKSYSAACLILGVSRVHHRIRSQLSVAKYCARHLPKTFSVLAVDNGKIIFEQLADDSTVPSSKDDEMTNKSTCKSGWPLSKKRKESDENAYNTNSSDEPRTKVNKESPLALVLVKNKQMSQSTHGWAFLQKIILHNNRKSDESSARKTIIQRILSLPSKQSMVAVYPDQKQNSSNKVEHHFTDDDEKNALSPSPCHVLDRLSKELEVFTHKYSSIIKLFSYKELCSATLNFIPASIIGKGGSSKVFKGHLPNGQVIAVKVLNLSEDGFKQFVSEIEIICSLYHNNVISLLGFSVDANNLLLVYDFLSRGSLEENLHGKHAEEGMFGWNDRYKVALNVAEALKYLHDECSDPIIHRDVKSSNILLSDSFEAQLADFGLAMHESESLHDMTTVDVAGTFGYLAPEYFMHGKVNDKIDVYAYGVILLELLSGRKPIDNGNPKGQESLVIWANPIVKNGKVSELLEPKLADAYNEEEAERMVLAAFLCTRKAHELRPKISIVLKLLEGETNTMIWARQQLKDSKAGECESEEIPASIQRHINLALMGLEDEDGSAYASSTEHYNNTWVEEYVNGRWSRSSSFD